MAIEIISKLKPKNGGTFTLMDAADVETAAGRRLQEEINDMQDAIGGMQPMTADEINQICNS